MKRIVIVSMCLAISSASSIANSVSPANLNSAANQRGLRSAPATTQAVMRNAPRMTDQQATKCIYSDKATESIYQDVQAVYGLDMIKAKEFYQIMISAKSCPELKSNLRKLRQQIMARFPTTPMKSPTSSSASSGAGSSGASSSSASSSANNYGIGSGTTSGSFGSAADSVPFDPPFPGDFYGPPSDAYGGFPDDDIDF